MKKAVDSKFTLLNHTNSPFGYFGSKRRIGLQIAGHLPPHNAWVEAFCGSAAITLVKPPASIEIINDIDNEIVNLFQQLRDNSKELCRLITLTPYSRDEFRQSRKHSEGLSNLERARRFLVAAMMSINGTFGSDKGGFSYSQSYSRKGHEARVNRWNALPERLNRVVERLKNVRIESKDARDLLKMFIYRPATLIYLDPPYLAARSSGYNIDANEEEFHSELLELANRAKCMIFISGYDNRLYRSLLTSKRGWKRMDIRAYTRNTTGKSYARTEVLWKNRHFLRAEKSGRVPIRLSTMEKKENKVNPERR